MTYQSAAPTNVAAGVSNGAAVYTTTLWQDSDDFLIRYWDGDSWELIGGATDLTFSGTSSPVTLNSSTGTDVTFTAGTGISLAATGTNTTITNSAPDQTVSITGAGINVVTGTYPNFTVTGTEVDGSTSNELQTYGHAGTTTYTNTLSGGGGSWSITGAGIAAISQTAGAITVTATEVDGSISNEGVLGIGAGSGTSSTLLSTTSGANAVTINAAGILGISESTSANGGSITLTATEVDGSTTNELQTIANTSNSTSHTATLSSSGGSLQIIEGAGVLLTTGGTGLNGTVTIEAIDPSTTNEIQTYSASGAGPTSYDMTVSSGGTVTLAEGSGIDLTRSGNTITVASTATSGYVNGGNSFGANATIGLNDAFRWDFETSGLVRGGINSGGTWWVGLTPITTAGFNISGLQNGIGMHVAGGTGLVSPVMLQTRGNGSGSTVLVLDAQHSFLNGNVEALIQNTSTSGSGGVVMELNAKTATGDPRLYMTIDGTTDWSIGIDNDDVDNLKLHRFAAPSDNNGEGTIEFGYDGTMIGMGINKTGIGTATNGYYALDIFGKTRADQFVNNRYDITSTPVATMAVGTAAGTSPTVDNTVTSVWGNAARLKFTSGSSPTANGVVCTITLGTEYTFNECIPIMQGRSTNAGAFNYSCSFNSGTRVITCTLVGTLTASTVYEFNIIFLGRN